MLNIPKAILFKVIRKTTLYVRLIRNRALYIRIFRKITNIRFWLPLNGVTISKPMLVKPISKRAFHANFLGWRKRLTLSAYRRICHFCRHPIFHGWCPFCKHPIFHGWWVY
eukprot:Lithocolla_globosa_v1_NODE_551_length_3760_cov_28.499055.p4 type:complete len:111 gc:universal NODE_551_length_3760_cov_28.499055:1694-2026(+)